MQDISTDCTDLVYLAFSRPMIVFQTIIIRLPCYLTAVLDVAKLGIQRVQISLCQLLTDINRIFLLHDICVLQDHLISLGYIVSQIYKSLRSIHKWNKYLPSFDATIKSFFVSCQATVRAQTKVTQVTGAGGFQVKITGLAWVGWRKVHLSKCDSLLMMWICDQPEMWVYIKGHMQYAANQTSLAARSINKVIKYTKYITS